MQEVTCFIVEETDDSQICAQQAKSLYDSNIAIDTCLQTTYTNLERMKPLLVKVSCAQSLPPSSLPSIKMSAKLRPPLVANAEVVVLAKVKKSCLQSRPKAPDYLWGTVRHADTRRQLSMRQRQRH